MLRVWEDIVDVVSPCLVVVLEYFLRTNTVLDLFLFRQVLVFSAEALVLLLVLA